MSKHTPGPWHVGFGNGEGNVFSASGRKRLEAGGTTLYPVAICSIGYDAEEDEANARLISESPNLLAVAQGCLGYLLALPESHRPDAAWLAPLKAAILKAGGEA